MAEGVLLYGKHGFQAVGKDISADSYFAGLSEVDQQTALKLGQGLRELDTNRKIEMVKAAIERVKMQTDTEVQKSTAEDFRKRLDSWDGKTRGFSFVLGNTSSSLQEAGIPKKQIRLDATKVITLLNKHNGMSRNVLKQLPELLETPIIVIDSKKDENSRIIMGDLKDENGKTVTAVLLLTPTSKKGNVLDLIKISSAEGRGHIQSLFTKEDGTQVVVRYVDKKRIQEWLNVNRVQFPLRNLVLDSGSSATNNIIPQISEIVKGKVFYDERINLNDLTEKQRDEIAFAGTVIAAIGNTVHFYNSQYAPKDSREARTNGWYDPKDGSIHLDIAKFENGEKSVLFTLSHELVHFIEDWSPAKYQTFANFLLKEYAEHGVPTDELVHWKMAELNTTDYDYAMSELVADACERMLLDSNAAQKLAELNKTDKKLGAKIKEFFSNVLKRIRNAYANYKGRTEAQYLQKMDDVLSKFHEMFAEALTDAARNYQDADGKLLDGNIKNQEKVENQYSYDTLIAKSPINITSLQFVSGTDFNRYVSDRYSFVKEMRDNARKSGNKNNTSTNVYLYCDDLGKNILIGAKSFGHGAERIDQTYVSVCKKIGDILKSSVVVNELDQRGVSDKSYVALGIAETATDYVVIRSLISQKTWQLTSYEILSAIKKESINKKMLAYSPRITLKTSGSTTSSTISIADFLQIVKRAKLANSVLSKDVLKNLGEQRIPDQYVTPSLKYQQKLSTTPRRVIASIIESTIDKNTPLGKKRLEQLKTYRENVAEFELTDKKVRALSKKIAKYVSGELPFDFRDYDNLVAERNRLDIRRNQLEREFKRFETLPDIKAPIERELTELRKATSEEQAKKGREMTRNAIKTRVEQIEKRDEKKKLYTLLRNTEKWINQPTKSQVHCPDAIKQPFLNLIKGIKGSKSGSVEGDVWQMANALDELAVVAGSALNAQNDTSMEYISQGYLDLPDDFTDKLRGLAMRLRNRIEEEDAKLHVVSELSAKEIKQLSNMIRQLRHAALEMQRLHTTARFADRTKPGNHFGKPSETLHATHYNGAGGERFRSAGKTDRLATKSGRDRTWKDGTGASDRVETKGSEESGNTE